MAQSYREHLIQLLQQDGRLIDEQGELMGNTVKSYTDTLDENLIELLLSDDRTREQFFIKIKDVYVFKSSDFKFYLEQNRIDNSFTNYANRIGLSIGGKFLKDNSDVVLDFPYKDCILEGGQSTEEGMDTYFEYDETVSKTDEKKGYKAGQYNEKEAKRNEVFFNNIIAKDEIDRLTEPKAFENIIKYDKDGEHKPNAFTRDAAINKKRGLPADTITDNLIIKGNNLLALHSLEKEFKGKIKLIYLDPPYNTGGDGFKYNDNFNHSSWLTFIKNRLEIAKNLMTEDGLIIIQIDSSRNNKNNVKGSPELAYLHILLDMIFERENYIGHLHWKKKKQPSYLSKIAGVMESILIYSKNENKIGKIQLGKLTDTTTRIDNSDNNIAEMLIPAGIKYMGEENTTIKKGIYKNKTMSTEFLEDVKIEKGLTTNSFKAKTKFRNQQSEINKFCELGLLYITDNNSFRRFKSEEEKLKGKTIKDLLLDWGQNQDATKELRILFDIDDDSKPFETPKPELLLHNLISATTTKNDLVLDFFAGSCTTHAVAHKLGRQYIGVDQMNYLETVGVERLKKVCNGEQGGVSKLSSWKEGGSFIYLELAKHNQKAKEQILKCNSLEELMQLFDELYDKYFLHYNIKIQEFKEIISKEDNFKALPLKRQQEIFCKMLDNNQLYVNASEMEDATYGIDNKDIALTKDFYQLKEDN
jgi:adenine-specific DNA-methyltransferase